MCVRCGEANAGDDVLLRIGDAPDGNHSGEGDGYMLNGNGKRECYHHSMICDACADDFMYEWNRGAERVRERKVRARQDEALKKRTLEEFCELNGIVRGEFKDVEFDNPDDYDQPTD